LKYIFIMSRKKSFSRRKFISTTLLSVAGALESGAFLSSNLSTVPVKGLSGIIKGTVLGGSDIYIPDSRVQLLNTLTKKAFIITSGHSGKFEFKDLEAGNYELTVPSMDGFAPVKVNLSENAVVEVSLRIKKLVLSSAFTKPAPITVADLKGHVTKGVSVVEVSDYVFGNYQGELKYPPNADGNPKKAFIVFWKDFSYRFIFAHESSYCPIIELPSGAGVCYQFFEGNEGKAELFNTPGRRERNTFVDIIEPGPDRVWVRWTYFGVNQTTGDQYYRATEDFLAYPNGIILRRQTYTSLFPGIHGHAREPIENIGMCPVGKTWVDILKQDEKTGEHHPLVVLDAFSQNRYDVFWKHIPGTLYGAVARRAGASWKELDDSAGVAFVIPMKGGSPFCVFGDASGFRHDFTRIKEHSHTDTGGIGWIGQCWDHWPIGWLNSQGHEVDKDSLKKYPNHFSPAGMDFFALPDEEAEKGVYYSLIGVGGDNMEAIRSTANSWLKKGDSILSVNMNSGADLSPLQD
jgi:hypothetical protein